VIYIAKLRDAVYVLHAFQKKIRATAKRDIELATSRLRKLQQEKRDEAPKV
jgi:phage-related protein